MTVTLLGVRQLEPERVYLAGHDVHNVAMPEHVRQVLSHAVGVPDGLPYSFTR